jgi:putative tryptophan/tyrosine transport system substrate-binding protein
MRRREFIAVLGSAAALPLAVRAQQPPPQIIGYLSTSPQSAKTEDLDTPTSPFGRGLSELGYVVGRNVSIEHRWAENQYDRLPALAESLVERRVSVIVATSFPAARAAKAVTSTIPIVFLSGPDPVKLGLVASLNHPGANLTGVFVFSPGLAAKRLEFLRELVPKAALIAFLVNPTNPNAEVQVSEARAAARNIGEDLLILNASTETGLNAALVSLVQRQVDALVVGADPMFNDRKDRLVALAASAAIPAAYEYRFFASAGGLMSYGASPSEMTHQLGVYTGRILKGAKPADLPVVQSTKFELVINLKTAKALGITVPTTLLARADEVIE